MNHSKARRTSTMALLSGLAVLACQEREMQVSGTSPSVISQILAEVHHERYKSSDHDRVQVLEAPTWDLFYREVGLLFLNPASLLDMIITRLAREHGWSTIQRIELKTWVIEEQDDVTGAVAKSIGGMENLLGAARAKDEERQAFWSQVRKIRQEVRQGWTPRYRRLFTEQDLLAIDEHLRNDTVNLDVSASGTKAVYRISGVGRPRP